MSRTSVPFRKESITLGVSACLLGEKTRYNGEHSRNEFVIGMLKKLFEFTPVCPETEIGLPTPREPVRLVGHPQSPRARGVNDGRLDITEKLEEYAENFVSNQAGKLCGFILKSRSPSCGLHVEVFNENGGLSSGGIGIFARKIVEHFPLLPVIEDSKLDDKTARDNFVEKVYAYNRSQEINNGGFTSPSHA